MARPFFFRYCGPAMNKGAAKLRELIAGDELLVCPVIHDALTARLAREAGFPCALMGGFGVAATVYGMPDVGLIGFNEMVGQLRALAAAVPGFPIIADGDTGYGNAMNVRRTVAEYARAGAACILIEDQQWPKKCGHIDGPRQVIPRAEAVMKIRAAVEAAREHDILILARTDARGAHGLEEALARGKAFEAEGADIVFLEALKSADELAEYARTIKAAPWANMMPKTPLVPQDELKRMGFKFVTYNVALPAMIQAVKDVFAAVKRNDMRNAPELAEFGEVTRVVGLPDYNALEVRYATKN
jgi:2-methylisocitrate lyase-like PEP mutase family enzyme